LPEKHHVNQPSVQTLASTEVMEERGKHHLLQAADKTSCLLLSRQQQDVYLCSEYSTVLSVAVRLWQKGSGHKLLMGLKSSQKKTTPW